MKIGQPAQVTGQLSQNGKKLKLPTISGTWDDSLIAVMPNGQEWLLWSVHPPAKDPSRYAIFLSSSCFLAKLTYAQLALPKIHPDMQSFCLGATFQQN